MAHYQPGRDRHPVPPHRAVLGPPLMSETYQQVLLESRAAPHIGYDRTPGNHDRGSTQIAQLCAGAEADPACSRTHIAATGAAAPSRRLRSAIVGRQGGSEAVCCDPSAGSRLEKLAGDRAGQYSIRISQQWRICFRWADAGPEDVEITDYH